MEWKKEEGASDCHKQASTLLHPHNAKNNNLERFQDLQLPEEEEEEMPSSLVSSLVTISRELGW